MFKKIIFCFAFFFASTMSCSEKKQEIEVESECEQILDVVTDCMGLHRGAFDYINNCGNASIERIEKIRNCDDILNYLEND
jgi:hypothetical protein